MDGVVWRFTTGFDKNGELHLRNWNAEDGQIVLLDGEWELYSSYWFKDGKKQQGLALSEPRMIQVPGDGTKLCIPGPLLHMDSARTAYEYM